MVRITSFVFNDWCLNFEDQIALITSKDRDIIDTFRTQFIEGNPCCLLFINNTSQLSITLNQSLNTNYLKLCEFDANNHSNIVKYEESLSQVIKFLDDYFPLDE